jgi:hypothetical protein
MQTPNLLMLTSASREATFAMDVGSIRHCDRPHPADETLRDKIVINVEGKSPALRGALEYDCPPVISLGWWERGFSFDQLVGRSVHIPKGYDELVRDHVSTCYYFQHLDFDDVNIQFLEREEDCFRIHIVGIANDYVSRINLNIETVIRIEVAS